MMKKHVISSSIILALSVTAAFTPTSVSAKTQNQEQAIYEKNQPLLV